MDAPYGNNNFSTSPSFQTPEGISLECLSESVGEFNGYFILNV